MQLRKSDKSKFYLDMTRGNEPNKREKIRRRKELISSLRNHREFAKILKQIKNPPSYALLFIPAHDPCSCLLGLAVAMISHHRLHHHRQTSTNVAFSTTSHSPSRKQPATLIFRWFYGQRNRAAQSDFSILPPPLSCREWFGSDPSTPPPPFHYYSTYFYPLTLF